MITQEKKITKAFTPPPNHCYNPSSEMPTFWMKATKSYKGALFYYVTQLGGRRGWRSCYAPYNLFLIYMGSALQGWGGLKISNFALRNKKTLPKTKQKLTLNGINPVKNSTDESHDLVGLRRVNRSTNRPDGHPIPVKTFHKRCSTNRLSKSADEIRRNRLLISRIFNLVCNNKQNLKKFSLQ